MNKKKELNTYTIKDINSTSYNNKNRSNSNSKNKASLKPIFNINNNSLIHNHNHSKDKENEKSIRYNGITNSNHMVKSLNPNLNSLRISIDLVSEVIY